LDISSIVTTGGNNILLTLEVDESGSSNMLRMARNSSAILSILQTWELVDAQGTEVISDGDHGSITISIDSVHIGSVSTRWEDTHDFPTKLTGTGLPNGWVGEVFGALLNNTALLSIIELLGISLINCSEISGISSPIETSNG
jgi:hypothetical protein